MSPSSTPTTPVSIVQLHGHGPIRQRLGAMAVRGQLPASLLLHGARGIGKQRLALWLGQLLLCDGADVDARPCGHCQQCRYTAQLTHPDLHWYFPRPRLKSPDPSPAEVKQDYAQAIADRVEQGGLYPPASGDEGLFVGTVRTIVGSAGMSPAMAQRKVFVIGDAERMVPQEGADQAANAFLKLLEEPAPNTTIILTSSEPGSLLPTIRSRVVGLRVPPVAPEAVEEFLADPVVQKKLSKELKSSSGSEIAALAGDAPGRLFAREALGEAMRGAQAMLEAIESGDRAAGFRTAFGQGGSKARGAFSDTLDALTVILHARARAAATAGEETRARGAACAVDLVERAKALASGNVNPQLITAGLIRDLTPLLR